MAPESLRELAKMQSNGLDLLNPISWGGAPEPLFLTSFPGDYDAIALVTLGP